jgi:aminopeptidase N
MLAEAEGGSRASLDGLIDALALELERAEEDPAFTALALSLPGLGGLMLKSLRPDPDKLFAALQQMGERIARRLEPGLLRLATDARGADASRSSEGRGWRSLKNAAMRLLAFQGDKNASQLLSAFESAATMTSSLGALSALSASGAPEFEAALASFEARWNSQPLVMDKWFAVQAAAPHGDVLARIRRLTEHPQFTMKNPNRARSVYGVFCDANVRAFHAADGSGYELVGKAIEEADARNPLLAARFVRAFEIWPRLDSGRRKKATDVLRALAGSGHLSDVQSELINKLLAAEPTAA